MIATNLLRAHWAEVALTAFADAVFDWNNLQGKANRYDLSTEKVISDLLSDLRHYCAVKQISFTKAILNSAEHYRAEFKRKEQNQ